MRTGGIRLESEVVAGPSGGEPVRVVHNVGHGGYGYQTSYGASQAVEKLVDEMLQPKARL